MNVWKFDWHIEKRTQMADVHITDDEDNEGVAETVVESVSTFPTAPVRTLLSTKDAYW